ncbi:hypothetical protein IAT38_004795 [Cryptococcus sp. DSM 104549]
MIEEEMAGFRAGVVSEAREESERLKKSLELVTNRLSTAEGRADDLESELKKQKIDTSCIADLCKELNAANKNVDAVINRDALEKEEACVKAFGSFIWNTLRDAIPKVEKAPENLGKQSNDSANDSSKCSPDNTRTPRLSCPSTSYQPPGCNVGGDDSYSDDEFDAVNQEPRRITVAISPAAHALRLSTPEP